MHNVNLEYLEETFDISPKVNGSQGKAHQVAIEAATREILHHIGEDPEREGLLRTPDRVARMYDELTAGYHTDPIKLINDAVFDVDYDEMVSLSAFVAPGETYHLEMYIDLYAYDNNVNHNVNDNNHTTMS